MALLDQLTQAEADRLWWELIKALGLVTDELDQLDRCPPDVRDGLYGPGVRESYADWRDELVGLLNAELGAWVPIVPDDPAAGSECKFCGRNHHPDDMTTICGM